MATLGLVWTCHKIQLTLYFTKNENLENYSKNLGFRQALFFFTSSLLYRIREKSSMRLNLYSLTVLPIPSRHVSCSGKVLLYTCYTVEASLPLYSEVL